MRTVDQICESLGISVRTCRLPGSIYGAAASWRKRKIILVDDRLSPAEWDAEVVECLRRIVSKRLNRTYVAMGGRVWAVRNTNLRTFRPRKLHEIQG